MSTRSEYISGLRKLADLLETQPDLPLPFDGGAENNASTRITFYLLGDPRDVFVQAARALPGPLDKEVSGDTYRVVAHLDGLHVQVVAYREDVCERVVTGTREVTKTVPDPMVTVPVVEVTETVEDVRWVCSPLLASEQGLGEQVLS